MTTTESFIAEADDSIHMSSKGPVHIIGKQDVIIEQNGSVVKIADDIDLASSHIRIR